MEEALVSVTTGALQPVMAKLAALLDGESKLSEGVRDEVELHTRDLTAIEAFVLMKSVEEDASAQDSAWMKEVQELSYDIEDDLDEFMAPVGDKPQANPDGFMDKIKTMLDRTKAHHQIASAIDDLKKKQVGQVAKRYKARQSGASNGSNAPKVDPRALTIFEGMSKLVDVDGHKKELIQLLFDCDSTQQQPNIVVVVGLGGLGKTTLANQVYQELKRQFECHVFVSVSSQNPDVVKVMRAIYRQLNEKYSPGMEDLQQLITMILDFLKNKRYFIVVDDIWDVETRKAIMCAFPTISSGSKIMITTRIDDVAQSCCSSFSGHIYNIRPLSIVHSRKLFYERLFDPQEKCPSHLEGISGQIFNKCASLPLAIIVISGVLAHRASEKELWEQVKDSVSHALRNSTIEDMVNIISLSYMDLPPHLKTCLLYLSIFPKDHAIEKENLIRRWIGEGFIHKRDETVPDEVAEMQVLLVLEGLNVYTQSMQFLERLGQLKNLWKLGIIFNNYDAGDYWEEHGEEIIYSICELSKAGLESLHICMNEATDEYFEGPWFPHPSCGLRELVIHGGGVTKVPAWMTSLIKLEKLHIPMDAIAEQDVEILGGLPSLRHLCIEHDEDEELELKDAMEKAMEERPNRPTLVWKFYD